MHLMLEKEQLYVQQCVSPWLCSSLAMNFSPCTETRLAPFGTLLCITPPFYLTSFFVLANLLAGKCSLAMRGRGALVLWSNPLTHTNPAKEEENNVSK